MAEVDDWAPVAAPQEDSGDDWAPVGASSDKPVAATSGEKQFEEDKRLVEHASGITPGALKAATYSGLNTFLLNAPSHVVSAYTALKEGKPYTESFEEQKRYEDALSRQYPKSSMAGTGAGIVGSFLVPMGAVGQAGRGMAAATEAALASRALPQVVKTVAPKVAGILPGAATAGAMTGVSSALENPVTNIDTSKVIRDTAIGAGLGAAGEAVIPALGRYFSKFPAALDSAGNLTPEAQRAVDSAFGGRLSPQDIDTFKAQLAQNFQQKGISPEVAKESLLAKEGVTPTRSMVTGERPTAAAADIAEKAAIQGEETLGQKAQSLAGTPPASPFSAAEAIHAAERNALQEYRNLRQGISQSPGVFQPETFDRVLPAVDQSLLGMQLPTSFVNTSLFPQAAAAKKFLEEGVAAGNLPNPNQPFNIDNLEMVRRELNGYWAKASPTDRRAVSAIIDGFDNAVDNSIKANLFTGNGRQLISDLKDSRDLWSSYKNKFYDNKGPGGQQFSSLMNALIDKQAGMIGSNLPQESAKAAQGIINAGLLNNRTGLAMYNRMESALGANSPEMQTIKDQIRGMVLNTNGNVSQIPTSIDNFLSDNPQIATKVFNSSELSDMRRLSEAIKSVSGRKLPNEQKENLIVNAISKLGSTVGALAAWNLHGPFAGAITYLGGEAMKAGVTGARGVAQRGAEKAGAPMVSPRAPQPLRAFSTPPTVNVPVRNATPILDNNRPDTESGYQPATPLGGVRPGRKSGGKVTRSLSDHLVACVDRAKKSVNNDTKVLLNADDTNVAKALEVASKQLED